MAKRKILTPKQSKALPKERTRGFMASISRAIAPVGLGKKPSGRTAKNLGTKGNVRGFRVMQEVERSVRGRKP